MLAVVLFALALAKLTLLTDPGLVGWAARLRNIPLRVSKATPSRLRKEI